MEATFVSTDDIEVGDRFRKDYQLGQNFLDSITEKGLIQPITIDQNMMLVAGGRRLAAYVELGIDSIPVVMRQVEDELDLRECELIENICRDDLGWVDKNALVARIHDLNIEKHGEKQWSMRKTATLINRSVGGIHRSLEMHKAVESLPRLKESKNEDEAVKLLRKLREKMAAKMLVADHVERVKKGGGKHENPKISLAMNADTHYNVGDAFEGMQDMLDNNLEPPIAFVEVDPPYGIDLKKVKKGEKDKKLDIYEEVEADVYPAFLERLCTLLYKTTPSNTRVCFWFGIEWYHTVKESLSTAGFKVDPIPCIWTKSAGQTNAPELFLARAWEPFLIATKGEGIPIRQRGRINVFNFPVVPATRKYHPTQRPIPLMQEILRTFAWEGSIIMVPFLGSGATLLAAYREGINGWGWDLNAEYKEMFMAAVEDDIVNYHEAQKEED